MTTPTGTPAVADPHVEGADPGIRVPRSAHPTLARVDRVSARMRRTAEGPLGPVVIALWAVAEALVFPLIPDSGLAGFTFASPRRLRRLWAAAVVGTVVGSLLAVWGTRHGLHWPLPLVTGRMAEAASGWVAADGAAALAHQPLSGVPVKAFNATGAPGVSLVAWAAAVALARGARMLLTGAIGAAAGWARDRWVPERFRGLVHVAVVASATVGLLGGLALVVLHWS